MADLNGHLSELFKARYRRRRADSNAHLYARSRSKPACTETGDCAEESRACPAGLVPFRLAGFCSSSVPLLPWEKVTCLLPFVRASVILVKVHFRWIRLFLEFFLLSELNVQDRLHRLVSLEIVSLW